MELKDNFSPQIETLFNSQCIKSELAKLIARCIPGMSQYYSSEGLGEYDIDQGYQKQYDCDKYWHKKI